MKRNLIGMLAIALGVLALAGPAQATTCSSTSTSSCTIGLTVTNGFGPNGVNYGTVTLTLNGNGTITVDVIMSSGYGLHNADFAFNTASGAVITGAVVNFYNWTGIADPGTPTFVPTASQGDGFGLFQKSWLGGTGASRDYTEINFTISGYDSHNASKFTAVSDLIAGNATGASNFFAGQIAVFAVPGCTGWVGNTGSNNPSAAGTLPCFTIAPEPGSLALFGTGLLAVAALIRRKRGPSA